MESVNHSFLHPDVLVVGYFLFFLVVVIGKNCFFTSTFASMPVEGSLVDLSVVVSLAGSFLIIRRLFFDVSLLVAVSVTQVWLLKLIIDVAINIVSPSIVLQGHVSMTICSPFFFTLAGIAHYWVKGFLFAAF